LPVFHKVTGNYKFKNLHWESEICDTYNSVFLTGYRYVLSNINFMLLGGEGQIIYVGVF